MAGSLVKTVTMKVLADAGDAQAKLDEIRAKGDEIDRLDVRLRVKADDADAKAKLDEDMAAIEALGAKTARVRITVDDRGTKEKLAEDKAAADAAGKSINDAAGGGGGMAAVGPIAMWGSLIGIIAGAAPALVSAGLGAAAFGALAYPAVSKVKTAYQGLSTAQQAYQQAVAKEQLDPTKTNQAAVKTAADNLQLARQSLSQLPKSEQAAVKGVQGLVTEFGKLSTAFAPQAFTVFAGGLKIVTGLLQYVTPLATQAAHAFTGVESGISKAIGLGGPASVSGSLMKRLTPFEKGQIIPPQAATGFQTFMKQMTSMVGPAISAITGLAGALTGVLGHALEQIAPMSVPFVNMLSKLVTGLGPTVGNVLQILVTAVSGIGQALQPLLGPLAQVSSVLQTAFAGAVRALAPQLGTLTGAIGKVAVALSPLITAAGKLVVGLSPVVGAIGQLVAGLAPLAGAIAKAVVPIAGAFSTAMAKMGPALSQLGTAVGQVATALIPLLPSITKMAVALMGLIPPAAQVVSALAKIVSALAPAITTAATFGATILGLAATFVTWGVRVVGVVVSTIATVLTTISGLPGKILGIFASAETWLFNAGKNIILGLIHGIESMAGSVVGSVINVGKGIIGGFMHHMGMSSPSKKMITLGQQTIQGLVIGLQGGQSEIANAAALIADAVVKPATSGTITSAIQKVASLLPSKLTGFLKQDNARLQALANQRAILEKEIQTSEQTAQTEIGNASIMNAVGAAQNGPAAAADPSTVIMGMQAQAAQLKAFASTIQQLKGMGLNATTLSQLIQGGAAGSLPVAQALTQGGKSAVSQINALEGQIRTSAGKLGDVAAPAMYQAGVQAGQGLATGLKSQLGAIDSAISQLAQSIITKLKADLKIKSPSQVTRELGQFTGQGYELGLLDTVPAAARAASRVASAATSGMAGSGRGGGGFGDVHIHFNGVVTDPQGAARQIHQLLKNYKRTGGGTTLGIA